MAGPSQGWGIQPRNRSFCSLVAIHHACRLWAVGKLTGNAIRVPTPNVSMAVLNLELETEVSKDEVNDYLRKVALLSNLRQQVDYVSDPDWPRGFYLG